MNIVTLKPPNEELMMKNVRLFVLDFARRFDPSLLMAVVMTVAYVMKRLDPSAAVVRWAAERIYEGTGFSIAPDVFTELLILGAVLIAAFRPRPRWTFILSLPLAVYIALAAWYGYGAGRLPYATIAVLAFAYGAHFWIHLQASVIIAAFHRIVELEERLEKLEPGGMNATGSQ